MDAVGPEGLVMGIDLSHPMLDLARERADAHRTEARTTVELRLDVLDAQTCNFPAGDFDLLYSRFGVMFFEDPIAAFANLLTALRPGGRLCFVCWRGLGENPWFSIPRNAAIKFLGEPKAAPPRAPGPMAFADTDYVTEILTGAGFQDITISSETVDLIPKSSLREAAEHALHHGPASRLLALHDPSPETVAAIRDEIESQLSPYYGVGVAKVPGGLHFVQARRPR
jgi:SAM-dependent methyltransferase